MITEFEEAHAAWRYCMAELNDAKAESLRVPLYEGTPEQFQVFGAAYQRIELAAAACTRAAKKLATT